MELVSAGADLVTTLEDEYFAKATPGLKQMVIKYPFTATDLAEAIQRYPEKYGRILSNVAMLKARESDFRAAYRQYKKIAPDTVFAPTYFLVDRHRGIGSGSPDGQLISIESRTKESIGRMETLLIHELVHFQQLIATGPDEFYAIFGAKKTLLALTVREGTAEFFADYATGRMTQHDAVDYCLEHEAAVWHRFRSRMNQSETDGWMWSTPDDATVPRDLAYILGSQIVKSYYDRADDKRQAVREILAVIDYPAFLEKSRYGEQFEVIQPIEDQQRAHAPAIGLAGPPPDVDPPRFLRPEELLLDTLSLVPHISEFADIFYDEDGRGEQRAWRYSQLTHAHNWGAHDIIISDTNFSWNGTGTDEILADGATLTLLSRTMPFSIPVGVLITSHYGDKVTASFARPDGEFTMRNDGETTYLDHDPSVPSEDRPPRRLSNPRVYGYSLWPYVFALMDLQPGESFVLPGYESSNDTEYYVRAVVHGTTTVTDERQRRFPALVVRRYVKPTLKEALALDPHAPGPVVEYYVSDAPPYYLGHRSGRIGNDGQLVVTRESVLLDFQTLTVSPRRRLQALLEIRRELLKNGPQVVWWNTGDDEED